MPCCQYCGALLELAPWVTPKKCMEISVWTNFQTFTIKPKLLHPNKAKEKFPKVKAGLCFYWKPISKRFYPRIRNRKFYWFQYFPLNGETLGLVSVSRLSTPRLPVSSRTRPYLESQVVSVSDSYSSKYFEKSRLGLVPISSSATTCGTRKHVWTNWLMKLPGPKWYRDVMT